MKVKFLTSLCGGNKDYHAGDEASVDDAEAIRLIDASIAKPVVKKDYDLVIKKLALKEEKEQKKQQQLEAIMYEDELKAEKEKLLGRVDEINKTLGISSDSDTDSGDGE